MTRTASINIGLCSVEGCTTQAHSKSLCRMHYKRVADHGNTEPNPFHGATGYSKYGPSCPNCGAASSKVKDSRQTSEEGTTTVYVRRRRQCLECAKRFTTYETTKIEARMSPTLRYALRQASQELLRVLKMDNPT